ncbi:MAG: methionyl-tRNA formyltransferase [bacterium]
MTNSNQKQNYSPLIFFGSSVMSVKVLNAMQSFGMQVDAIVTVPDKPQGRKLVLTANPTKLWAIEHNIPHLEFAKLNDEAFDKLNNFTNSSGSPEKPKLFIVASYGKIIPERFLEIPDFGALNVHPSKLPEFRGASPLQSTILADKNKTAVTVIKMDKEMDHGPIFAQKEVDIASIADWPVKYSEFESITANIGAELISENIDAYINSELKLIEQNHSLATFTKKITKEDGQIDPWTTDESEQRQNILKIRAFEEWPGAYFFIDKLIKGETKKLRVIIKDAEWIDYAEDGRKLHITKVVPEGGKEMTWKSFLQSMEGTGKN